VNLVSEETTHAIELAFAKLRQRSGFTERPSQVQLAMLLSDLIGGGQRGLFEAPTGLGKSLATLIPAVAHANAGKRIVIATYTNVLAEQYWHKDLPTALSLFEENPSTAFLIGRQRYVCLTALDETDPHVVDVVRARSTLGIESEFRKIVPKSGRELSQLWQKAAAPPVCPARLCPMYDECFYYEARRKAETASIVITNHAVVIQDAIMAQASADGTGPLGKYDFLILDEAHDFLQAATNGLEFELSPPNLSALLGILGRCENALLNLAEMSGEEAAWRRECASLRTAAENSQRRLSMPPDLLSEPGILAAAPSNLAETEQIKAASTQNGKAFAEGIAQTVGEACATFVSAMERRGLAWRSDLGERARQATDGIRNYSTYIREFGLGCQSVFEPQGVSVSYLGNNRSETKIRRDIIGLAEPLTELLWNRVPYAALSATMVLDGSFDFFKNASGARPDFEEVLPTPFDFATQAAVYLPKAGAIPDPSVARQQGSEPAYYRALARELGEIIEACEGRTLALFHSRKEMEGVFSMMMVPEDFPILMQPKFGAGNVGERFRDDPATSLFALRSFWTGFDAPGETLSCVALVRVPFEVPVEPPQIARAAYMRLQGQDPFREFTLANTKMLMRQGAGRLIRTTEDVGIIALLDPRLRTKRYGAEILDNLPSGMRTFDDIADAVGWINR